MRRGVRVEGGSRFGIFGVARSEQRLLRFTGSDPRGQRRWIDDSDPDTSCPEVGQRVYSRPRLLVRQEARMVAVTFVSRRTTATGNGCLSFHPAIDEQTGESSIGVIDSCADVAFGAVLLREPLGGRRLELHVVTA